MHVERAFDAPRVVERVEVLYRDLVTARSGQTGGAR
jgi:hypothetical protein